MQSQLQTMQSSPLAIQAPVTQLPVTQLPVTQLPVVQPQTIPPVFQQPYPYQQPYSYPYPYQQQYMASPGYMPLGYPMFDQEATPDKLKKDHTMIIAILIIIGIAIIAFIIGFIIIWYRWFDYTGT